MTNPPSGSAYAAAWLQTGTPGALPRSPAGLPEASSIDQLTSPPFAQPVPVVQTARISPRALIASAGCFTEPEAISVAAGVEPSMEERILPLVSQAARIPFGVDTSAALLIGHLSVCQGSSTARLKVVASLV